MELASSVDDLLSRIVKILAENNIKKEAAIDL